jgi:hypothetical protein
MSRHCRFQDPAGAASCGLLLYAVETRHTAFDRMSSAPMQHSAIEMQVLLNVLLALLHCCPTTLLAVGKAVQVMRLWVRANISWCNYRTA